MLFAQTFFDPALLAQYGILGIVLLWFMFRFEKRLDKHSSVINDLAESILLDVLSRESISDTARARAESLLNRVQIRSSTTRAHPGDVQ